MGVKINHLDLFSGIGGFHMGFKRAGFEPKVYFSEVDKHAVAVYKHQFKDSEYVGSVTDVRGRELPQIDLITFGSPCQDFSLAGKRQGMGGERSGLILEAIRLIGECRPRVFVWENVKGAFSSNDGRDFAAILKEFANLGGYRLEWQLLNTSWFLPQNRERIYLVGYSTTPRGDWGGVFPIKEGSESGVGVSRYDVRANCIPARYGNDANGSYVGECELASQKIEEVIEPNYDYEALNKALSRSPESFEIGRPKAIDCYNSSVMDVSPCLRAPEHNSERVFDGYRIRRLTPIECERLQGFPDNHTKYGIYDGEVKKVSNTQRYKQCGNAVTVDVVHAIAEKCKPLFDDSDE